MKEAKEEHAPDAAPPGREGETAERPPEEQLARYWKANGRSIIAALAAGAIAIVAVQGTRYALDLREQSLREAYGETRDAAERLAFAEEHPGHPLAALACLEAGHEEYAGQNYTAAAGHYEKALDKFEDYPPFAARARLGLAMCAYMNGNRGKAAGELQALAASPDILDNIRAEAACLLAAHYWDQKDTAAAREELRRVDGLKDAGVVWKMRAEELKSEIGRHGETGG